MATTTLIASFVRPQAIVSGDLDTWAALEQAYKPRSSEAATLRDIYAMKAYGQAGKSAYEYLQERCPYAVISGEVLTVKLDFYVWVSSLGLNYQLTSDNGTISAASRHTEAKSFDVIFDHADRVSLGSLFTGNLVPQMPFFDDDGTQLGPPPAITMEGSTIRLSQPATCVLRANGRAEGFKHTLTLTLSATDVHIIDKETKKELDIIPGYALDNLSASITVTWQDGGVVRSNILQMDIPDCVEDLVNACDGSTLFYGDKLNSDDEPLYVVQYSTCNGEVLNEFWQEPKK